MKTHKQCSAWAAIVASVAFVWLPLGVKAQAAQETANSQSAPDAQNSPGTADQDPASRVARLNNVEGSVSFQPGGENDWVDAVLNRPLVTGDNLWADENSRAEVHIGSTALRLGPKTGITLLDVSDREAQIRLVQGSLIVKVRHVDAEDSYEVDTPNVAFVVVQPGEYRIDVSEDGTQTDVIVWRGRGEVTGGGNSYTVMANQHATFTGTDQLNYDAGQIPAQDGFDSWAFDRDQTEDRSDSANYVSREMTGYEDLDEYGSWSYVADYGPVWRPTGVALEWAPYHFGHWIWVGPWGWTWVEDEPWGFAPFHYGRWAFAGGGWVWVPGPHAVRPLYAPALVAWVGGAPGFHSSVGVGVGWFPLAPGEVFVPGYRVSRGYVNRVNITNTAVNVTKVSNVYNAVVINRDVNTMTYANRNVSGGVTVVSHDTFVNARPVARNVVVVPAKELASAPVAAAVAIEPARASVLGTGKLVANRPPAAVLNRPVVALRTPPPMPGSFDQRQAQAGGHLNQQSSIAQPLVRQEAPGRPVPVTRLQTQSQPQSGFRAFGDANAEGGQAKPQPRVWEAQGTPEPEPTAQTANRNTQSPGNARPAQSSSHPPARPVAPVQERSMQPQEQRFANSQPQRPATPTPPKQENSHPAKQQSAPAPKK